MKPLMIGIMVFASLTSSAEEIGTLVAVSGELPIAVPFLRCRSLDREVGNETRPTVCKDRETKATFGAKAARVTNLGDTIVWIHVGEDKLPVLPKSVVTIGGESSDFRRLFLSVDEGEVAKVHVFASDRALVDRAYVYPVPDKSKD